MSLIFYPLLSFLLRPWEVGISGRLVQIPGLIGSGFCPLRVGIPSL